MELKTCPFCGGPATAYQDDFKKVMVSCDKCGAMIGVALECGVELVNGWTAMYKTAEEAVNAWNNREKVVHGRWIRYPDCGVTRCINCGWNIEECFDSKYCPNCGAKMDID